MKVAQMLGGLQASEMSFAKMSATHLHLASFPYHINHFDVHCLVNIVFIVQQFLGGLHARRPTLS